MNKVKWLTIAGWMFLFARVNNIIPMDYGFSPGGRSPDSYISVSDVYDNKAACEAAAVQRNPQHFWTHKMRDQLEAIANSMHRTIDADSDAIIQDCFEVKP